jgi:hypothetical protein
MIPTASARRACTERVSPKILNASAIPASVASWRTTAPEAALMTIDFVPCSSDRPTHTPRSRDLSPASAAAPEGSACIFAALTILSSRYGVIESTSPATRLSTYRAACSDSFEHSATIRHAFHGVASPASTRAQVNGNRCRNPNAVPR